jgi:signal transduction histidine kinase
MLRESDSVIIYVTDDGTKFSFFENLKLSKGLGLKNVLSRINNINAIMKQAETINGNKLIIKLKEKL